MKLEINGKTLELMEGDVTEQQTDAVVNAANSSLILGAGVAGAIRTKGGPTIQEACNRIGGCPVGGAVITTGGRLKARHVIHAVGPRMGEGNEDDKLKSATLNSLKIADENNLRSLAFPAISTGIFGFPLKRCSEIMLGTAMHYLGAKTGLDRVIFCLFGQEAFDVFRKTLGELSE